MSASTKNAIFGVLIASFLSGCSTPEPLANLIDGSCTQLSYLLKVDGEKLGVISALIAGEDSTLKI